jgi:hypothetical protein
MITVNVDKAKLVAHEIRRTARQSEFAPLDQQIQLQIPGTDFATIDTKRQAVRDKYATIQNTIDQAVSEQELVAVIKSFTS